MNKQGNVSDRLGKLLLQGWTMTEHMCPMTDCDGTPLMRPRNSTNLLCVGCNNWFALTKAGQLEQVKVEPDQVPPQPPQTPQTPQQQQQKQPQEKQPQQKQEKQKQAKEACAGDEVLEESMQKLRDVIKAKSAQLDDAADSATVASICAAIESAARAYKALLDCAH